MNRLRPWQSGFAGTVTFSVLGIACALAFTMSPDNTIDFFNQWFLGLELRLLRPPGGRPPTLGPLAYGLVGAAVVSFVVAASLASFYNLLARAPARS
ncbi:MAG TPA: DUF5676 family membrane protein [Candidatus Binatia bacterium]|nr:DUF5676 family membrane protein [Candidatus Binatia bacterium]